MTNYSDPLDELYAIYISSQVYLDRYDDLLDPIFQQSMEKFSSEILCYFKSKTILERYKNQKKEKQYRENKKTNK